MFLGQCIIRFANRIELQFLNTKKLLILIYFREVVELILGRGFDINVRTARGTALHEAAVCGKKDVVKYLLESNVNLELRDRDDKTVLEVMDDLNTPMTREVIHLVLGKKQNLNILYYFQFGVKGK